jgi:TolA-binding protein
MRIVTSILAVLLICATLRADTVWVSSTPGGAALPRQNVKVAGIRAGSLVFNSSDGRENTRELAQVARLQIDDEPALNTAEEALLAQKFDVAADGYQKTLNATKKDWLKLWAGQRLALAGQRANRFDAAVDGYIAALSADTELAAQFKPALPADAKSPQLAKAVADVTAALNDARVPAPSKQALQTFLAELQQARGMQPTAPPAGATPAPAAQANPATPAAAAPQVPAVAAVSSAAARSKLDAAASALAANDFARAQTEIESSRTAFVDRNDQAQAMFYLAEAKAGLAAQKNDQASWQDAALAYMRVVAHFKDPPASPFVPRALLKTAEIQEKLSDTTAAKNLYTQITQQYANDPAAAAAKAAIERLK